MICFSLTEKEETGIAPQFTQPLKPQVIKPQESASLRCLVRGEPTPLVRWYRGDQEVKSDKSRRLSFDQKTGTATLTLLEATPEDETIYRVVATNKFGRAECRANLILGEQVLFLARYKIYQCNNNELSPAQPLKLRISCGAKHLHIREGFSLGGDIRECLKNNTVHEEGA